MTQFHYRAGHDEIQPTIPDGVPDRVGDDRAAAALDASAGERSWGNRHPVNIRLSLPLPFVGRWYITVVAGRERRRPERLAIERRQHPLRTVGNVVFAFAVGAVVGLALLTLVQLAVITIVERFGAFPGTT